jgi:hypothetical protein
MDLYSIRRIVKKKFVHNDHIAYMLLPEGRLGKLCSMLSSVGLVLVHSAQRLFSGHTP